MIVLLRIKIALTYEHFSTPLERCAIFIYLQPNKITVGSPHHGCQISFDCFVANYNNCQKYIPIDLANLSRVIASGANQSLRVF